MWDLKNPSYQQNSRPQLATSAKQTHQPDAPARDEFPSLARRAVLSTLRAEVVYGKTVPKWARKAAKSRPLTTPSPLKSKAAKSPGSAGLAPNTARKAA